MKIFLFFFALLHHATSFNNMAPKWRPDSGSARHRRLRKFDTLMRYHPFSYRSGRISSLESGKDCPDYPFSYENLRVFEYTFRKNKQLLKRNRELEEELRGMHVIYASVRIELGRFDGIAGQILSWLFRVR